ncbi:MAG: MBL fold metallo-hydrolase [Dehalococcoidia bacterium]
MEVYPGIHHIRLPIPFAVSGEIGEIVADSNSYLIRGNDGWLLVDPGWDDPQTLGVLEEGIRQAGASIEDISQIVATHFHPDHYGLAGQVRKISGAKVALHQKESPFIELRHIPSEQRLQGMTDWLLRNGVPENEIPDVDFTMKMDVPDVFLSGGEKIGTGQFDFEVMWTPGHSPGHICLYDKEKRLLISGDHIIADITPDISAYPMSGSNPLGDYLNSLRKVDKLDVQLVLPGHGSPFDYFQRRVNEILEHHRDRMKAILGILKDGPMTAYEIASRIQWIPQKGGVAWEALDSLNQRMALMETLAHLGMLQEDEEVGKVATPDLWRRNQG